VRSVRVLRVFITDYLICNRMRNATILVLHLRGVATEVIKNIVLAGIGKIIIVDDEQVHEEDLGAGFFFRDEDIGKKVSELRNNDSQLSFADCRTVSIRESTLPRLEWRV
jgi:molybdopterin/thiamine biosynthesis adenylyltransferase